jgi:hypothetical protein
MNAARVLGVTACVLLAACAAEAGTMTVGQTRDYTDNGSDRYFVAPGEIIDHSPWFRVASEDWGWSHDLSALAPADATGIASATLTIKAWSTRDDAVDDIYANGVNIGSLGWNGLWADWEVSSFDLPAGVIEQLRRDGRLDCSIDIDRLNEGKRVTLKYAMLTVVYLVPGAARAPAYDPAADPDSFPDPPNPYWQPGLPSEPETTIPGEPLPTTPGEPSPTTDPTWKDTLFIENHVQGFTDQQNGVYAFMLVPNAADGLDANDVTYGYPKQVTQASRIVSVVADRKLGSTYELSTDARPATSGDSVRLQLSLASASGQPVVISAANELRFSFPAKTSDNFSGKPITLQQYDPCNPAAQFPIYDVRALIAKNAGILPLRELSQAYHAQQPYACFTLSFNRALTDLSGDGRTNLTDFALLAQHWMESQVVTVADIAGAQTVGIPDGNVDVHDLQALCGRWLGADIKPGTPAPADEGFESGDFTRLAWTCDPDSSWLIASDCFHSGRRSARPMSLSDGESCDLSVTLDCTDGRISFFVKTSCETYFDNLEFSIDGQKKGAWSGLVDWKQVSFPVPAGPRVFTWTYRKDGSYSAGEDTAWIDDVQFPIAGAVTK